MALDCTWLEHEQPQNHTAWVSALWMGFALALGASLIADMRAGLYPVKGQVTSDGQVPKGARIVLVPLEVNAWLPTNPTALVASDGSFLVKTLGNRNGARPGTYAVTITWRVPEFDSEERSLGPNRLPPQYANARTTPWKITVLPQSNTLIPVALSCSKSLPN
jgi:hypothetical protein